MSVTGPGYHSAVVTQTHVSNKRNLSHPPSGKGDKLESMRKPAILTLALLALVACTPASLPKEPVQLLYITQDNLIALNTKLNLRAYPTILITSWAQRDYATDVTFESPLMFTTLHSHFHHQMLGNGWQRSRLNESKSRIQARYQRGSDRLELRLSQSGNEFRLQTW